MIDLRFFYQKKPISADKTTDRRSTVLSSFEPFESDCQPLDVGKMLTREVEVVGKKAVLSTGNLVYIAGSGFSLTSLIMSLLQEKGVNQ